MIGSRRCVRVVGLLMVRNAVDVVELSVRHHLRLGLERILAVDNGSTDGTAEVLRRLARELPLRVEHEDGPFRQDLVFTRLAREASRDGADWVLPIDADEFWVAPEGLHRVVRGSRAGALSAPIVNFVQRRDQHAAEPAAMLAMTMRVPRPLPQNEDTRALLDANRLSFLELAYPPKHLVRAAATVRLVTGNHVVRGADGPIVETERLVCLHAPLRSRAELMRKAQHGARVEARGFEPDESWHVRRWRRLWSAGALVDDWPAHSYSDGRLDVDGRRPRLIEDTRLRDCVAPLLEEARS